MLKSITLENFKCFKDETRFPLSKINLFTGVNGKGKSSVLQALLLMKQSVDRSEYGSQLHLSGDWVDLGTFQEVKNKYSEKEEIKIKFEFLAEKITFSETIIYIYHLSQDYKNGKNTALINKVNDEEIDGKVYGLDGMFPRKMEDIRSHESFFFAIPNPYRHIHYVSAARITPENSYKEKELKPTGGLILKQLVNNPELVEKVNAELAHIFDEDIKVEALDFQDPLILRFHLNGKRFFPTNIGFGYSYILPIIVSGLIAQENEILIIENPEAHLHPRSQSRLAQFLARVASTGVQVFIESHSEHILNGIRVATLIEDIDLSNQDVSVLYFQDKENQPFVQLPIEKDGSIKNWVDGFFDQQEVDLAELFKLNKRKK